MRALKLMLVLVLGLMAVSCWHERRYVQVLNIRAYDDCGFVNANKIRCRDIVRFPKELVIINELPGSRSATSTRVFVVSPLRLEVQHYNKGGQLNDKIRDNPNDPYEKNKFLLELHRADLVKGLPGEIQTNTIATLRYMGSYIEGCSTWERTAVDTDRDTLRMVTNVQVWGGSSDWICTDLVGKSIDAIKEGRDGQRIIKKP